MYIEALADIPLELLAVAVKHEIVSNPYFPKPADLRAAIRDELYDHRRHQEEMRLAALPKPVEAPPPSAEDVAYVDELIARSFKRVQAA